MCNVSIGCLEHVRRIVCAEGTTRVRDRNRCAMCDERSGALPLRAPFCYLDPRTATRNVLDDRGPVVSLNRLGGSKSLWGGRFRRWWCAGLLCPNSTPFGVLPSHPTQFLCGVCHARACPAVLCDLSDLERLGVDGPSVCSGAYAGISLCSKDLRNGVCLQHTFPSRADPICMLMAYKEMDLGKTVASPRL